MYTKFPVGQFSFITRYKKVFKYKICNSTNVWILQNNDVHDTHGAQKHKTVGILMSPQISYNLNKI